MKLDLIDLALYLLIGLMILSCVVFVASFLWIIWGGGILAIQICATAGVACFIEFLFVGMVD